MILQVYHVIVRNIAPIRNETYLCSTIANELLSELEHVHTTQFLTKRATVSVLLRYSPRKRAIVDFYHKAISNRATNTLLIDCAYIEESRTLIYHSLNLALLIYLH